MRLRHLSPALALALAGCWVPLEKGRQMDARIQRLEVEEKVAQDHTAELEDQLRAKLREVQQKLDELNTVSRAKGADLGVAVVKLNEDLTRVKGEQEAQAHYLEKLQKELAEVLREVDAKLASLRGTGALDEAVARQKLSELPRPDDRAAVLDLARKVEDGGEKGVAREILLHYVKRWPRDDKAPEAAFRAAQLTAGQGRWREAVVLYGKVAEDYPKSERVPDAQLHAAEALLKLDRKDDARSVLEQLVADHPKSDAAKQARARLAELSPPAKDAKKPPPPPKKK